MWQEDFDRILSDEEEILPSSGFAASVMDAVRREASAPPPIPFPWKRAMPGLVVAGLSLVLVFVEVLSQLRQGGEVPQPPSQWSSLLVPILGAAMRAGAGWIVLALLLALVSVMLSTRFASGKT